MGLPLNLSILIITPSVRNCRASPELLRRQRDLVERLLVHEIGRVRVGVKIGGFDCLQIRLLELLAGFEGLVEDRTRKQVTHLQPNQRLSAPRGGRRDVHVEAVIGGVFKFEIHLALDIDCVNQCGHGYILAAGVCLRANSGTQPGSEAYRLSGSILGGTHALAHAYLFPALWVGYLAYWQVMSANVKVTQRLEPAASRILRMVLFLNAMVLLLYPRIPLAWLYWSIWPSSRWTFFIGAAITAAGLLFSVWARRHLGRNWSRSVTIKEDQN